mmetsp:Transcript_23479/g.55488  ORF Transcript_23479/g.55488 Transcript_23479/m.55488 type:complete len:237 (+) Transcript_23479:2142-2852(+)
MLQSRDVVETKATRHDQVALTSTRATMMLRLSHKNDVGLLASRHAENQKNHGRNPKRQTPKKMSELTKRPFLRLLRPHERKHLMIQKQCQKRPLLPLLLVLMQRGARLLHLEPQRTKEVTHSLLDPPFHHQRRMQSRQVVLWLTLEMALLAARLTLRHLLRLVLSDLLPTLKIHLLLQVHSIQPTALACFRLLHQLSPHMTQALLRACRIARKEKSTLTRKLSYSAGSRAHWPQIK